MTIFIGADHGGFKYKAEITEYLERFGFEVTDTGNTVIDPLDDYPDFAFKLGKQVSRSQAARGIFICRSGAGACIAANKVKGIRAAQAHNLRAAKMARVDDDANVLCLGADYITLGQAKKIVRVWLKTKFSASKRHHRRINKIIKFER